MGENLAMVLEAGSLLIIETGCYSDKRWDGPIKMLVTKTKQELANEFRADWKPDPDQDWIESPRPEDFLPWLIRKGYAEDHFCRAWHVGDSEFLP